MDDGSRIPSRAWLALAPLIALLAIPGVFTLSSVFFVRDLTTTFLPHHLWFHRTLLDGHLPLWNPGAGGGYATVSDPLFHTLFPPTLPLRLLPPILGFNLIVALPFPLAALGMVLFLRRRVSSPAAVLGASVVAASGPFLSTASTPNLAWSAALIPWVLAATDAVALRATARSFAALAVVFALQVLAGEPVTLVATAALAVAYAALAARPSRTWRSCATATLMTGLAGLAGALLAAVQVLPLLAAHRHSIRAAGSLRDTWSLHPARLVELVVPFFFGKWVGTPGEITQWLFAVNDGREPFLVSLYVGVGAVLLAIVGVTVASNRRRALFWSSVLAVSLVAALGASTPIYPAAQRWLPLLAAFRFPSKHVLFVVLALGVLAALGFDAISRDERVARRELRPALVATGLLLLAATAGMALAFAAPGSGRAIGERLAHAWSLPAPSSAAASFVARIAAGAPRLFALAAAAGLAILLAGSRRPVARSARVGLFGLVIADLVVTGSSINPTLEAAALAPFPWVALTERHPGDRLFVSQDFGAGLAPLDDAAPMPIFPPDVPPAVHQAIYDTALLDFSVPPAVPQTLARDLTGLRPREYLTLLREFTDSDRAMRYRFLSWAGTRYYLVSALPPVPATELTRLPKLGTMALYEVAPAGSRARVVESAAIEPDPDAQIARLFDRASDPGKTLLVDRASVGAGEEGLAQTSSASVVEESADAVTVEAAAPAGGGYLLLLDSYDPGWKVEVDRESAPLLRADGAFRAVRLVPGRHRVRFSFRPRPLALGAAVSLLAGLGLVALVLLPGAARAERPLAVPLTPTGADRPVAPPSHEEAPDSDRESRPASREASSRSR